MRMFYISTLIFSVTFLCIPFVAVAAEITLETNKEHVAMGEQFIVSLSITSEKSVNAVQGQIVFPASNLEFKDVRSGNSSITFWVEGPDVESPGVISFSGITPGGFSGNDRLVFSAVFEGVKDGEIVFALKDVQVLLNDGLGTKDDVSSNEVATTVTGERSDIHLDEIQDTELPETFTPLVGQDTLFEGKYFVAFATQDKNSGIHHYEIKEYRLLPFLGDWKEAASPYVLNDQTLQSFILIKAIDNAGNKRMSKIEPTRRAWYEKVLFGVAILLMVTAFVVTRKIWLKSLA